MIIIPSVPTTRMVDASGNVTNSWRIYFEQLSRQLQTNVVTTYEEFSTVQINAIPSGERNGRFIYDTDTGQLKVGFNDAFAVVDTS